MGDLANTVRAVPVDTGGQRHQLPGLLAALSPEDAEDLKELLADPHLNCTKLTEEMCSRGFNHSFSTYKRWWKEVQAGRRVWEH